MSIGLSSRLPLLFLGCFVFQELGVNLTSGFFGSCFFSGMHLSPLVSEQEFLVSIKQLIGTEAAVRAVII